MYEDDLNDSKNINSVVNEDGKLDIYLRPFRDLTDGNLTELLKLMDDVVKCNENEDKNERRGR